jgi:hypothetical protein
LKKVEIGRRCFDVGVLGGLVVVDCEGVFVGVLNGGVAFEVRNSAYAEFATVYKREMSVSNVFGNNYLLRIYQHT